MERYLPYLTDGVANGVLYSLLALALVMTYRSTRLLNVALGEIGMLATFVAWTLLPSWGAWLSVPAAVAFAALLGAVLEWVCMRRLKEGQDLHAFIVSVGLLTIVNSAALALFGSVPKPFPSPFGEGAVHLRGVTVSHQTLGVCSVALVIITAVFAFFRWSWTGRALRATAQNALAAKLVGVPVKRVNTTGWALSCALAAVAGMLAAPRLFLQPSMMQGVLVFSLSAAVLGGLNSAAGAVIGGVVVGVLESFFGGWPPVGSDLKTVATVGLLALILVFRPTGLLGTKDAREV